MLRRFRRYQLPYKPRLGRLRDRRGDRLPPRSRSSFPLTPVRNCGTFHGQFICAPDLLRQRLEFVQSLSTPQFTICGTSTFGEDEVPKSANWDFGRWSGSRFACATGWIIAHLHGKSMTVLETMQLADGIKYGRAPTPDRVIVHELKPGSSHQTSGSPRSPRQPRSEVRSRNVPSFSMFNPSEANFALRLNGNDSSSIPRYFRPDRAAATRIDPG